MVAQWSAIFDSYRIDSVLFAGLPRAMGWQQPSANKTDTQPPPR